MNKNNILFILIMLNLLILKKLCIDIKRYALLAFWIRVIWSNKYQINVLIIIANYNNIYLAHFDHLYNHTSYKIAFCPLQKGTPNGGCDNMRKWGYTILFFTSDMCFIVTCKEKIFPYSNTIEHLGDRKIDF